MKNKWSYLNNLFFAIFVEITYVGNNQVNILDFTGYMEFVATT